MVVKIEVRTPGGMNAATTTTSGKNDTNALPARATLRSTNSISNIRSHTCHNNVRCARWRDASIRWRSLASRRGRGVTRFGPAAAGEATTGQGVAGVAKAWTTARNGTTRTTAIAK